VGLDLYGPELTTNPQGAFRRLLSGERVHRTTSGIAIVCRYDNCAEILLDDRWSVDPDKINPVTKLLAGLHVGPLPLSKLEPPEHTAVRRLVGSSLTRSVVKDFDDVIGQIADELIERLVFDKRAELMSSFVVPLVVQTLARLLAIPPEYVDEIVRWNRDLSARMEIDSPTQDVASQRELAVRSSRALFARLISKRREERGRDVLSALVAAEIDGRRLNDAELAVNVALLSMATQEPLIGLVGSAIVALLSQPKQVQAAFWENDGAVHVAVEELLRFSSPVQMRPRVATVETFIGDSRFRAGDQILLFFASANRDHRVFVDPDVLDLERRNNPHLAFGLGRHTCIGMHLARRMAALAVSALFRGIPSIRLNRDNHLSVQYERRFAIRRPACVHADWQHR
jgi:cytochrome P450